MGDRSDGLSIEGIELYCALCTGVGMSSEP